MRGYPSSLIQYLVIDGFKSTTFLEERGFGGLGETSDVQSGSLVVTK